MVRRRLTWLLLGYCTAPQLLWVLFSFKCELREKCVTHHWAQVEEVRVGQLKTRFLQFYLLTNYLAAL
jgi:hypothetical protein